MRKIAILVLLLIATSLAPSGAAQEPALAPNARWSKVAEGLKDVVAIATLPEEPPTLLVAERAGRIRLFERGALRKRPLLSVEEILTPDENLALTSVAIAPDYLKNRAIFISYTDRQGDINVGRFVQNDSKTVGADDLQIVMKVVQPIPHNERSFIGFGPDGYLYLALGDTPEKKGSEYHAQNPRNSFGKILRVDVSNPERYSVPKDNPIKKGSQQLPEIWCSGLQAPRHLTFDKGSGALFLIDSGVTTQEINNIQRDNNYGWNITEGARCLKEGCDSRSFTPPVFEFESPEGHPASGGAFYHGTGFPLLRGAYLFAHSATETLSALRNQNNRWTSAPLLKAPAPLTAIGTDSAGEIFATTTTGELYQLTTR